MKRWLLAGLASLALLVLSPSLAEAFYAHTSTVLNGSTNVVSVPFPYLQQADVGVTVNGTPVTVTWPTLTTVQLPGSASSYSGKTVVVTRVTQIASPDVVFVQGALNPLDLNTMSLQTLYAQQEIYDAFSLVTSGGLGGGGGGEGGGGGDGGVGDGLGTFTPNGNTQVLATIAGTFNTGDGVAFDVHGNLVDTGAPPGDGGSAGLTGAPGQIGVFNSAGDAIEGTSILPAGTGAITQGVGDASDLVATDNFVLNNATAANRNLLLNGEFVVSQWAPVDATGTQTFTAANRYVIDRWEYNNPTAHLTYALRLGGVIPPAGYAENFGFKTNTVTTPASTDEAVFQQNIEQNNLVRLGFGTVAAQNLSLSFWVRASVVGTYGGSICNSTNSRCFGFSYVVTVSNAWTFFGVPIPADGGGTWGDPSGILLSDGLGMHVNFSLAAGASQQLTPGSWVNSYGTGVTGEVNLEGTLNATWYTTGIQLEIANEPTAFEHVPPFDMLLKCQRYAYYAQGITLGLAASSSALYNGTAAFPVTMRGGMGFASSINRAAPAFGASTGSAGTPSVSGSGGGFNTAKFSNSAANWTTNAAVTFTGMITAELF